MVDFLPGYVKTISSPAFKLLVKDQDKIVVIGFKNGKIYGCFSSFMEILEKVQSRKTRIPMVCYFPKHVVVPEIVSKELNKHSISILDSTFIDRFVLKAIDVEEVLIGEVDGLRVTSVPYLSMTGEVMYRMKYTRI